MSLSLPPEGSCALSGHGQSLPYEGLGVYILTRVWLRILPPPHAHACEKPQGAVPDSTHHPFISASPGVLGEKQPCGPVWFPLHPHPLSHAHLLFFFPPDGSTPRVSFPSIHIHPYHLASRLRLLYIHIYRVVYCIFAFPLWDVHAPTRGCICGKGEGLQWSGRHRGGLSSSTTKGRRSKFLSKYFILLTVWITSKPLFHIHPTRFGRGRPLDGERGLFLAG